MLKHIREINQRHEGDGRFTVGLFGWDEIVRRAMLDPAVMAKHFGPSAGAGARSPLLATWFMSEGRLDMTGDDLALAVAELSQDLHDWPTGHFVIRQRESDALLSRLRNFEGRQLSRHDRESRIKLRAKLRKLTDAEDRAVRAVSLMLVDPDVSDWLRSISESYDHSAVAIESFVNEQVNPSPVRGMPTYLRMTPPDEPAPREPPPRAHESADARAEPTHSSAGGRGGCIGGHDELQDHQSQEYELAPPRLLPPPSFGRCATGPGPAVPVCALVVRFHVFPARAGMPCDNRPTAIHSPYTDQLRSGDSKPGDPTVKKVTMNLTPRDIENADTLTKRLHSRNKASTVSAALAITEGITRRIEAGGELMIRKKDGSLETVLIAGMDAA